MIQNLEKYFLPEQVFYLNSINYKLMQITSTENILNCIDNLSVEVNDAEGVKVILTRSLEFNPEGIFELNVSFGANLKFNEETKNEINWHEINLAEEFRVSGNFVIQNLLNRISLLIAEITASFGQSPIILPPSLAGNRMG